MEELVEWVGGFVGSVLEFVTIDTVVDVACELGPSRSDDEDRNNRRELWH